MVYLLCKYGRDWYEWNVMTSSKNKDELDLEAKKRNIDDYGIRHKQWIEQEHFGSARGGEPLPLDDPRRDGPLTYFVISVPEFPEIDEDYP